MSSSTIAHRTRPGGPWQRLLPGVLLVYSGSPSRLQRMRAALVYAGADTIFTGVTALRCHGVRKPPTEHALHVLVPHSSQRSSRGFVILERTRRMPDPRDVVGLPCAPVARAAIDAARRVTDVGQVRALLSEVVQRGMCTVAALGVELRDAQIRGTALPRRVLREVSDGVRSAAEAEARQVILRCGSPSPCGITTFSMPRDVGSHARTPCGSISASCSKSIRWSGIFRRPTTSELKPDTGA